MNRLLVECAKFAMVSAKDYTYNPWCQPGLASKEGVAVLQR